MKKRESERPFKRQKVTDETSVEELEVQFRKHSLTTEDRAKFKKVILNVRKDSREKGKTVPIIELYSEDGLEPPSLVGEGSDSSMETIDQTPYGSL